MRLLLGALLLGALFAAAWFWQRSFTSAARTERELLRGRPASAEEAPAEGEVGAWGRVTVGRPSGAEPFEPSRDGATPGDAGAVEDAGSRPGGSRSAGGGATLPGPPAQGSPRDAAQAPDRSAEAGTGAAPGGAAPAGREFQLIVQPGQTLSTICRAHYGSGRRELVRALARYNGIEKEDELRAGRSLVLPPIETLLPGGGR